MRSYFVRHAIPDMGLLMAGALLGFACVGGKARIVERTRTIEVPGQCLTAPPPEPPGVDLPVCPHDKALVCLDKARRNALANYLEEVQPWMDDAWTLCGPRPPVPSASPRPPATEHRDAP